MLKRTLVAVTLFVLALVPVPQAGQQPPSGLTALDYFEIENLYARYCHGFDSGADNGYMYADVFTPDGVFIDANGRPFTGRESLAALARGGNGSVKGATTVSHFVTGVVIEPSAGGARGQGYLMIGRPATPQAGAAAAIVGGGLYSDDLVKTADGWRIRRRVLLRLGAASPEPLAAAPAAAPPAPRRSGAITLVAADYAEILHLYGRYGYAFDGGVDEGRMWAQMFTEDGFHVNHNANEYIKGHDALAEFARGATRYERGFTVFNRSLTGTTKDERRIGHIITNVMLTPVAGGVVVKAYRMTGNVNASGAAALTPGGIYFDYLVKTPQGWRYKEKFYIGNGAEVPPLARKYISIPDAVKPEFTQTSN